MRDLRKLQNDLSALDVSALLLKPKPAFLQWLKAFLSKRNLPFEKVYFPEDDSVWVIPKVASFGKVGSFEEFLEHFKPRMLLSELYRFGAVAADFPHAITPKAFDEFFDFSVRHDLALISELSEMRIGQPDKK